MATPPAAPCYFEALPAALVLRVLQRVPADARGRCACVCRAWRTALDEPAAWAHLDLSPAGGVATATDALLAAAAARARGQLLSLDVSDATAISLAALCAVAAANAGTLTRLRACHAEARLAPRDVDALLAAAPRLAELSASLHATPAQASALLRPPVTSSAAGPPAASPLRLHALAVRFEDGAATGAEALLLASELAAWHAGRCSGAPPLAALELFEARLDEFGVADALCAAAAAADVAALALVGGRHAHDGAPALARLLAAPGCRLRALRCTGGPPLDEPGSAALGAALAAPGCRLTELRLRHARLWRCPPAAAALLFALVAHRTLRVIDLRGNAAPAFTALAGAALGGLLAADAPALHELDCADCWLFDAGLAPLLGALARNRHLRALRCANNRASAGFARAALLPAVAACASLRRLEAGERSGADDATQEAYALLLRRCAADDAAADVTVAPL
jgi:hypothetical protein